jgi:low affinity Fe/Cu permease
MVFNFCGSIPYFVCYIIEQFVWVYVQSVKCVEKF